MTKAKFTKEQCHLGIVDVLSRKFWFHFPHKQYKGYKNITPVKLKKARI